MNPEINNTENFNLKTFSADVFIFSIGQGIILLIGFLQSLIIPKYLSITDYGYWQIFSIYLIYTGIFHLGFLDGIFIRWAGKTLEEIKGEIPLAFKFIALEQGLFVGSLIIFVEIINIPNKLTIIAVLIYAIILNLIQFFLYISQATKQFRFVSIVNITKTFLFFLSLPLILFFGSFCYSSIIIAFFFTSVIILILFFVYFKNILFNGNYNKQLLINYGKDNIGIGIFILLGNFVALMFTSIDRLMVGSFFSITQFAIYSFAVSMCYFLIVFLQAVAQVFFPYLSGSDSKTRKKTLEILKPAILIFWSGSLALFFPFSIWIQYFLPNYVESLPLMAILLCTIGFSGQIQILHVNLFKVYRKQRVYLIIAGFSLIIALILNLIGVKLLGTLNALAMTVIISYFIWYFFNELILRKILETSLNNIFWWTFKVCLYIGAFLVTVNYVYIENNRWTIGFCSYFLLFVIISYICNRNEIYLLINQMKGLLFKKI